MGTNESIAATVAHHLVRHHPVYDRPARRDAHPKHHGCVAATFVVEPDLPEHLRVGVFETPGRRYAAVVRFSNALKVRHDRAPDARGLAVKLLCAPGSATGTQDFLMVSHPVFFAKTADDFLDFPAAVGDQTVTLHTWRRMAGFFFSLKPLRLRVRGWWALMQSLEPTWSPLAVRYFSQAPFRFGDRRLMKYAAFPTEPTPRAKRRAALFRTIAYVLTSSFKGTDKRRDGPRDESHDELRTALEERLKKGEVAFDFCLQVRELPADAGARARLEDDALTNWSERRYPFRKVATLRIQQPSEAELRRSQELGEHLSFNPWNHVADHEPVGSVNNARRVVYERISVLRHDLNKRHRREPRCGESLEEYLNSLPKDTSGERGDGG